MRHVTTDMVWWSESSRLDFLWAPPPLPLSLTELCTVEGLLGDRFGLASQGRKSKTVSQVV